MTDDPRVGDLLLKCSSLRELDVALVFFPVDEGVRRNGGRVGAEGGPLQFMTSLQRTGALV
jgi:hypothetical protein